MSRSPQRLVPVRYRLRVEGRLDQHWSHWFGDLTLAHEEDGTTTLTACVADQAELHGLLTKIRDLGITLISVARLDLRHPSERPPPDQAPPPPIA